MDTSNVLSPALYFWHIFPHMRQSAWVRRNGISPRCPVLSTFISKTIHRQCGSVIKPFSFAQMQWWFSQTLCAEHTGPPTRTQETVSSPLLLTLDHHSTEPWQASWNLHRGEYLQAADSPFSHSVNISWACSYVRPCTRCLEYISERYKDPALYLCMWRGGE